MPFVLLFPYTLMASYYQNLPFILSEGFLWHIHMHVRGRARSPGNSPQPVMDTQLYNLLGHTTLGHIPQHLPGLSLPHPHLQIEPQLPPAVTCSLTLDWLTPLPCLTCLLLSIYHINCLHLNFISEFASEETRHQTFISKLKQNVFLLLAGITTLCSVMVYGS